MSGEPAVAAHPSTTTIMTDDEKGITSNSSALNKTTAMLSLASDMHHRCEGFLPAISRPGSSSGKALPLQLHWKAERRVTSCEGDRLLLNGRSERRSFQRTGWACISIRALLQPRRHAHAAAAANIGGISIITADIHAIHASCWTGNIFIAMQQHHNQQHQAEEEGQHDGITNEEACRLHRHHHYWQRVASMTNIKAKIIDQQHY